MSSQLITTTIVQLDLVNSSRRIDTISRLGLSEHVQREYYQKIEKIVHQAFDSVNSSNNQTKSTNSDIDQVAINNNIPNSPEKSNLNEIIVAEADGYKLRFKSVDDAYQFVEEFRKLVDNYNNQPGIDKWEFRFGIATGNISYDESSLNKWISSVFKVVKELETGAYYGWVFVNEGTYNTFSDEIKQKHNFSKENIKNKHGQAIQTWGFPMLSNARKPIIEELIDSIKNKRGEFEQVIRISFSESELNRLLSHNESTLGINKLTDITGEISAYPDKINELVSYLQRQNKISVFLNVAKEKNNKFFERCIECLIKDE